MENSRTLQTVNNEMEELEKKYKDCIKMRSDVVSRYNKEILDIEQNIKTKYEEMEKLREEKRKNFFLFVEDMNIGEMRSFEQYNYPMDMNKKYDCLAYLFYIINRKEDKAPEMKRKECPDDHRYDDCRDVHYKKDYSFTYNVKLEDYIDCKGKSFSLIISRDHCWKEKDIEVYNNTAFFVKVIRTN